MIKYQPAFIIFIFWMLNFNFGLAQEESGIVSKISELRIFNRVILLVKENYVEPERFDPKAMLLAALRGIEQRVPELVITELPKESISVQVGSKIREFSVGGLTSLWDLSFRLRDIFKFMELNLLPETDQQEIEYAAANGALSVLDPHSILFEPKISAEVKNTTRGEFGGLGVQIGLRDGSLTVISPVEGTPAFKAGIKPLDKIIKIEEESTVNLGLDEAVELLRGKPGTSVAITVDRKGEPAPIRIVIVRDIIKVDSVSSHLLADKYGYINIKTFHGNTDQEMKDAIAKMQKKSKNKLAGLILDFRNNPGGLLLQSIAVSDLFLDGGVVVVTQGANESNREEETANAGPGKTKMPIIVLVNGGSASASEIVAGALKNRGRGIVIGEQTFGKGSVQILYDFPDKSSLKLTIAQYLTPGNESIQSVGITPDILLRPMYADDKTKMLLFPGDQTREEDLAAHLDDETRIVKRKPIFELSYLAKILSQNELEKRAVLSSFNNDYEISFAQKILEATESSSREDLLRAAKALIKEREASESALLLTALKKFNIDWSPKPAIKKKLATSPKIAAKVKSSAKILAGNDLVIDIDVKNIGKVPVYRVFGITKSVTPLFDEKEFLFGKLLPGQNKSWKVNMKIPVEALTRRDEINVILKGDDNLVLETLKIPVNVKGLPKPKLAYSYFLDDSQTGNGDGNLDEGESVDLVVLVKNIGKGIATEPWALLKNVKNTSMFINKGRHKFNTLKPGDTATARLSFTLRGKVKDPTIKLQLYDAVMGDFWGEEIVFSQLESKDPVVAKAGKFKILESDTALYSKPTLSAQVLAYLPKDVVVALNNEIGKFSRVKINNDLSGFVLTKNISLTSEITAMTSKTNALSTDKSINFNIAYNRIPPQIDLALGQKKPIMTGDSYELPVHITSKNVIKDAFMFVNENKVHFQAFDDNQKELQFKKQIKLKPGVNIITVVARVDHGYGQKESIIIFSEESKIVAAIENNAV